MNIVNCETACSHYLRLQQLYWDLERRLDYQTTYSRSLEYVEHLEAKHEREIIELKREIVALNEKLERAKRKAACAGDYDELERKYLEALQEISYLKKPYRKWIHGEPDDAQEHELYLPSQEEDIW